MTTCGIGKLSFEVFPNQKSKDLASGHYCVMNRFPPTQTDRQTDRQAGRQTETLLTAPGYVVDTAKRRYIVQARRWGIGGIGHWASTKRIVVVLYIWDGVLGCQWFSRLIPSNRFVPELRVGDGVIARALLILFLARPKNLFLQGCFNASFGTKLMRLPDDPVRSRV